MKQVVTRGIILARTNFGEADRILTILTYDQGKIRAIAKGVRKVKSKLAGGIELFSISQISFIRGRSEIYTLTSTRLEKHFGNIVKNLERTMFGYEVLKLINKIVEDNIGSEYFDLLEQVLEGLDDLDLDQNIIELWLYAQLLKLSGHSPNLRTDTGGNKLEETEAYNFDIDKMSFAAKPHANYNSAHIKLFRLVLNIKTPLGLKNLTNINEVLPACLQLTKIMMKQFQ